MAQTYWSYAAFFGGKSSSLFTHAIKRAPRALLRRGLFSCPPALKQILFSKFLARKEIFSACAAELRRAFCKPVEAPDKSFLKATFGEQGRLFGKRSSGSRRNT